MDVDSLVSSGGSTAPAAAAILGLRAPQQMAPQQDDDSTVTPLPPQYQKHLDAAMRFVEQRARARVSAEDTVGALAGLQVRTRTQAQAEQQADARAKADAEARQDLILEVL